MNNPFYSVIIPTYNRREFLKKAVTSVLSQNFRDFELIVIDDGSTDGTGDMLAQIPDKRLRHVNQENKGVAAARNLGISLSRGTMLAFLDSDDYFKPQKLEITRQYIGKFPDFYVFHTDEIWFRNGELLNQKKIHAKPDGYVFEKSLRLCCISPSTAVVQKKLFAEIGLFDEEFPACEDYDFWLRATSRFPVKLIPQALTVKSGGHPDQLSKKYPAMDTLRIKAIKKLLDTDRLDQGQRSAAITELRRKCLIYIKGAQKRNKTADAAYYSGLINTYTEESTAD